MCASQLCLQTQNYFKNKIPYLIKAQWLKIKVSPTKTQGKHVFGCWLQVIKELNQYVTATATSALPGGRGQQGKGQLCCPSGLEQPKKQALICLNIHGVHKTRNITSFWLWKLFCIKVWYTCNGQQTWNNNSWLPSQNNYPALLRYRVRPDKVI